MSRQYDVIIIGAGHNGLVCANILSRKDKNVLVLEANDQVGGMAASREFCNGFKASAVAHLHYGFHPSVYAACGLSQSNFQYSAQNLSTIVVDSDNRYIKYDSDHRIIANSDGEDGIEASWLNFHEDMTEFSKILYYFADKIPPRLKHGGLHDKKTLLGSGLIVRKLSQPQLRELLRVIGMNIYDLVEERLENDLLKSAICFESILGTRLGPRAPNTVYNWLSRISIIRQHAYGLSMPQGGMGSLCETLNRNAIKNGVEINTGRRVTRIHTTDNRVDGVEMDDGELIRAGIVISNADIKQTMVSLVGAAKLDTDVVRRVSHIPMQGTTAKIHLALDRLPSSITGDNQDFESRIIYAANPDAIERTSNAIKYGEYSDQPIFEILFPTIHDSTMAPEGKHIASVLIPYVPCEHNNGWAEQKIPLQNLILDHIERILPGTRSAVIEIETLTPQDIAAQFNVTDGHWHHGEIGLERFLMLRPAPKFAQYKTPVDGLYLCGADCHPGGDVNGAAGLNAANAVLNRRRQ